MPEAQQQQITEVLFNRGTVMDLFIGKPTFQKKLRADDLLMGDSIKEDAIYLGHKKLLPKEAMEKLQNIEGRARQTLATRSVLMPIANLRFVYYRALRGVLDALQELKDEWSEEVNVLEQSYPQLKETQLLKLDEQAQTIYQKELAKISGPERDVRKAELDAWLTKQRDTNRGLYPDVSKLREMFNFSWRIFKVSALTGQEQLSELSTEDVMQANDQMRRDLQTWVRSAAAEMHKALGEAAQNAKELLEKNDKLDPRNLRPLFNAFETFKAVDFTGCSSFQEIVEEVKKRFGRQRPDGTYDMELTSESVSGTEVARAQFGELLGRLGTLAVEECAEEAGLKALSQVGEFQRTIEL